MTNTQIAVVLVGWAFLFYLNNRTLRRSELSRLKDNLTKELEKLFDWLNQAVSEQLLEELELEQELATKVSLIEMRFQQLNDYTQFVLFNPQLLTGIRNIDVSQLKAVDKLPQNIHLMQYDILEEIEQSYHQHYFQKNVLVRLWLNRRMDFLAANMMLVFLILVFSLMDLVFIG